MPNSRIIVPFIGFLFFTGALRAQPGRPATTQYSVVRSLDHAFFGTQDSAYHPVDPGLTLSGEADYEPGQYPVTSGCTVNGKVALPFARAELAGDTLKLTVYLPGPDAGRRLDIRVSGDSFDTAYRFQVRGKNRTIVVEPTDQVLVLDRKAFRKGEEIRGFVNFRGTAIEDTSELADWDPKEDWVQSRFVISGPFRAVIR